MAGKKKVVAEVIKEEPKKKAGRKPATNKAVEKKVIDTEAKIVDVAEEINEAPEKVAVDIDKSLKDKKIDRFVKKYAVLGIEREVIEEKYDAVIDLFSDMVPDDFKEYLPDIIFAAADKAVAAGLYLYTKSLKDRKRISRKNKSELTDDERVTILKKATQEKIDKRKEREKKYEDRLKAKQQRLIAKIKGEEVAEEAVV